MCLPQKGRKHTTQEVFAGDVWAGGITAFRLLLRRLYTSSPCSPSNFHLGRDAQQTTRVLQVSNAPSFAMLCMLCCPFTF